MTRACRAISRYTKVKFVGLCYGIYFQLASLAKFLEVKSQDLDAKAAGLNHLTWIMDLRFKDGRDVYPVLNEKLRKTKRLLLNRPYIGDSLERGY